MRILLIQFIPKRFFFSKLLQKIKKAPKDPLQGSFEQFKQSGGSAQTKIAANQINQKLLNDTLKELKVFLSSANYMPTDRAERAGVVLKKLILCGPTKNLEGQSQRFHDDIERFARFVWDDVQTERNPELMLNLFWFAVHNEFYIKDLEYADYVLFFILNANYLVTRQLVTLINILLYKAKENPGHKLEGKDNELLEQIARTAIDGFQANAEEYRSLVDVILGLRRLGFDDEQFISEGEGLLQRYLPPFSAYKLLAFLDYHSVKARDFASERVLKIKAFKDAAEYLSGHLMACSFDELVSFCLLYLKETDLSTEVFSRSLIENIFDAVFKNESLAIQTQKLLDMLELCKGKISIKFFLKAMWRAESHIMRELKTITSGQLAQFLFLAQESGYRLAFKDDLIKRSVNLLHVFSLDELLRATWANSFLLKSEEFENKMLAVLDKKVKEIAQNESAYVPPAKVLPFLCVIGPRLDKTAMVPFEDYLQHYTQKFGFRDLAVVLWSIVQKTKIKRKTALLLVQRYFDLLEQMYQSEWKAESHSKTSAGKASDLTAAISSDIGTWEVMTILWGFSHFDLDSEQRTLSGVLEASRPLVQLLLEEFSRSEVVMVARVFLGPGPAFERLFAEDREFYDVLVQRLEEFVGIFDLNELTIVAFLLSKNKALVENYESTVLKFVRKAADMKNKQRQENEEFASTKNKDKSARQSDRELEERFKEHF